ncbi:MAG: hypothetical protein ACI8Q3_000640 [Marinomonas primoryensis]|jgi:hypothetical protein
MNRPFSSLISGQPDALKDLLAVAVATLSCLANALIDKPSLVRSIGSITSHWHEVKSVNCLSKYFKSKSKCSVSSMLSELKSNLSFFKVFSPRPERTNASPIDSETDSRRSALEAIAKLMRLSNALPSALMPTQ